MMAISIYNLPKAVCECKAETWDLPVPNCDRVVRQTMLINDNVIQGYLTNNTPAYITAPIRAYRIIAIAQWTSQKQLMVRLSVHHIWSRHCSWYVSAQNAGSCSKSRHTSCIHEVVYINGGASSCKRVSIPCSWICLEPSSRVDMETCRTVQSPNH